MRNSESKSKGFKPKQICELVDITQQTLRYWRENLYPSELRSFFNCDDVFIYHLIKAFVKGWDVDVKFLVNVNWLKLKQDLNSMSALEKKSTVAVYDKELKNISLYSLPNKLNLYDRRYRHVLIEDVMKDYNISFTKFGVTSSNIVPINEGVTL